MVDVADEFTMADRAELLALTESSKEELGADRITDLA
jgi:hypothetical protein